MPGPTEITPDNLMRRIGLPDAPRLIDVRIDEDFDAAPALIPGARRQVFSQIEALLPDLAGSPVVVICQKGLKLSQGAAAILRSHGLRAETLAGGAEAWQARGLPMVPVAVLPGVEAGGTLWVTRQRPKIDRIACPWLIRRFVDRDARFLFVAQDQVALVADRFGAIPFDIEDVFWSHRGERCSFDMMLDEFCLHTEALDRMAGVIRAADTNRHDLAPEAAGLLALSVGYSRQYRDDIAQLEATLPLYDSLYRWARDGFEETHDWPNPGRG